MEHTKTQTTMTSDGERQRSLPVYGEKRDASLRQIVTVSGRMAEEIPQTGDFEGNGLDMVRRL